MLLRMIRHTALLVAVAAPALAAQQDKAPPAAHEHAAPTKLDAELADHFKGIALTEAQVKQVTAIKARHHGAMDALKKDAKDQADPALKAAMAKHMAAEHGEFKALLTAEQYQKFEENMSAHHAMESKPGEKHEAGHDMGGMKHDAKAEGKVDAKKPSMPATKKP